MTHRTAALSLCAFRGKTICNRGWASPNVFPMAVWRNWVGNHACEPREMAVPRDEAEVRSLVSRAARAGLAGGKLHFMTPDRLDELFPEIERFRELRRELDPSGVFLNPHLRELFA